MFFVSQYYQSIIYDEDSEIIWHSIFGHPMVVDRALADELTYRVPSEEIDIREILKGVCETDDEMYDLVDELLDAHILITSMRDESYDISQVFTKHNFGRTSKVDSISLMMSEDCADECFYCMRPSSKRQHHKMPKLMSAKIAKKSIDNYIAILRINNLKEGDISFGGGEPLLNWDVVQDCLPYIEHYRRALGIPIKLSISTNLKLMTEDIAATLIYYGVEVRTSFDGTKVSSHDYDEVIRGLEIMEELSSPVKGFKMMVTRDNFADLSTRIIDLAYKHSMKEVRVDVDVIGMTNTPVEMIAHKLVQLRKYAKPKGINVVGFWSRPAENLRLDPEKDDVGFCRGEKGNSLCVSPSGQVFPCGYSNHELCDYKNMPLVYREYSYNKILLDRDLTTLDDCYGCPILGFCRGGCMINREANATRSEKVARMCELYLIMTRMILRETAVATAKDQGKT